MKIIFLTLVLLSSFNSTYQQILEDSVFFEADNSYRKLKIWLPEDFDPKENYHTRYTLDADLLFNPLIANTEIYSYSDVGMMPPTIVIGIYFNQRNDDMNILWDLSELGSEGIAFKNLIIDKIIPRIESNYNVADYRSIVGHSNSSTFIQFFLLDSIPTFQGYLLMSEFELKEDAQRFCQLNIPKERSIDFTFISAQEDAEYRYNSGLTHEKIFDACSIYNFNYDHIVLNSANHLTMVPQGIPLGLESLYREYKPQVLDIDNIELKQHTPISFMDSIVHRRCSKYGIAPQYSFEDLDQLYELYIKIKDSVNIQYATNKYAELIDDSTEYFYTAQCLESMGAYHSAEEAYLRHLEYSPYKGQWSYKRIVWLYMTKIKKPENAIKWATEGYKALENDHFLELLKEIVERFPATKKNVLNRMKVLKKSTTNLYQNEVIEKWTMEIRAL